MISVRQLRAEQSFIAAIGTTEGEHRGAQLVSLDGSETYLSKCSHRRAAQAVARRAPEEVPCCFLEPNEVAIEHLTFPNPKAHFASDQGLKKGAPVVPWPSEETAQGFDATTRRAH
jgi:hypothetical protein